MSDSYNPSDIHLGGRRTSPSMLDSWHVCPQYWFLHYLTPHPASPTDTAGLGGTAVGESLFLGTAVHVGLEAFRRSGWADGADTGLYNKDAGVEAARAYCASHAEDLAHPDQAPELAAQATELIYNYAHDHADNPLLQWRVAPNKAGQPLLEQELEVPLLGGQFALCAKIDAVGLDGGGVTAHEYKTCGARYVKDWTRGADLSAQGRAEAAALRMMFPELTEVRSQFELIVKDRGKTSKYEFIEPVPFTLSDHSLAVFLTSVERVVLEIVWSVAEWRSRIAKGDDPWLAGLDVFPVKGMQGSPPACVRFGKECDFAARCRHPELPAGMVLGSMEARTKIALAPIDTPTESVS